MKSKLILTILSIAAIFVWFADLQINAQSPIGSGVPVYSSGTVTCPHFGGTGTAPTFAYGAGAGSSPTAATFDATASDTTGTLQMILGSSTTTSAIVGTLTFNTAYATAPHVVLYPANAAACNSAGQPYITSTTGTFVINSGGTALTASGTLKYTYVVLQ